MILAYKFVWAKYYQYKSNLIIFRIFSVYKRERDYQEISNFQWIITKSKKHFAQKSVFKFYLAETDSWRILCNIFWNVLQ